MYPNWEQQSIINKTIGCSRFVYNYYLNKSKKQSFQLYDEIKDIQNLYIEYPWLKDVDSVSLRKALFHLEDAYQRCQNHQNNFPKYKSKIGRNSYSTDCMRSSYKGTNYHNIEVDIENHRIKLPKLEWIEVRGYRTLKSFPYKIKSAIISKEAGKYYVSVLCEEEIELKEKLAKDIIGIDIGIKDYVITSEGVKYKNEKAILKYERKIKGLQKSLSRKEKRSKNYNKLKVKLQRVYQKLRNARKFAIHKITKELTDKHDIIVTEKLQTKKLIEEKKLSKYITDASFTEILRQLEYKCKWKGKRFYQVERYYASSQICSGCGERNEEVTDLSVRKWECKKCHQEHDRDINAAINIMGKGLEYYLKEVYY